MGRKTRKRKSRRKEIRRSKSRKSRGIRTNKTRMRRTGKRRMRIPTTLRTIFGTLRRKRTKAIYNKEVVARLKHSKKRFKSWYNTFFNTPKKKVLILANSLSQNWKNFS